MQTTLFHNLSELLQPVLIAGLTLLSGWTLKLIAAKVRMEYLRGVLIRLDDAVLSAVKEVSQTYVDALKNGRADGTLTDEESRKAKELALASAKSYLGMKGLSELARVLGLGSGEAQSLLSSKIEAAVHDLNVVKQVTGGSAASPQGASPLAPAPAAA